MQPQPVRDQVLAVNVGRRWGAIAAGDEAEADVVLGAWSPWVGRSTTIRHFDPDRVAAIIACRRGETVAVYDVRPDADGRCWHWVGEEPRRRIVFHGAPSNRFAAQRGAPAPKWKVGEGTPVKLLAVDDVLQGAEKETAAPTRHAVVGQAVVTLGDSGHLTVSVPPEYRVTVTTRAPHNRSL
ncbi:hypothetical protein ACIOG4_28605 [Streptomyces microflavus]|uniref:hypothetical protein n=1 Tax=Streptomyces microflavus TaxID=1919 RepID=UPI0038129DC3